MTTQSVATYLHSQMQPGIDAVGGFYRTCVLTGKALFRRPFQWREAIMPNMADLITEITTSGRPVTRVSVPT